MPRRGRTSSLGEEEDPDHASGRPRRGATKTVNYAQDGAAVEGDDDVLMEDASGGDSDAEVESPASLEEIEDAMDDDVEEEEEEGVARRRSARSRTAKAAANQKPAPDSSDSRRTSSRANKFKDSMKEPSATSIRDLLKGTQTTSHVNAKTNRRKTSSSNSFDDDDDDDDSAEEQVRTRPKRGKPKSRKESAKAASPHKSPARRHRQARSNNKNRAAEPDQTSSDESSASEEYDDEDPGDDESSDEQEPFKIQRIIASRTEPRNVWTKICAKMNTTEIDFGSRWVQDQADEDDDTYEERFLVKWSDMSYLHLSWETESDLLELVEGAKTYLTTFFRKSSHGVLFSADERCDGDYFDPAWTQVDRILELHFPEECPIQSVKDEDTVTNEDLGMIFDKANPDFSTGCGRELLVKWGNCPYSETTYEYERDLILNDVDYKDALKDFICRSKKPSKDKLSRLQRQGEAEKRRLYKDIFGDNSGSKSEESAKEYQQLLENRVFKCGGQLRDYQAEGVAWMMNNYVNDRGSILADEMGLGKTIQTAAFINLIATELHRTGPFLIVAPLSTLAHWQREFSGWTNLNTIVYHGSARDRGLIREMEFAVESIRPTGGVGFNQLYLRKCKPKRGSAAVGNPWMVEVVITTPELLTADDFQELTAVEWEVVVVDEAHRLKTHTSKFSTNLRDSRFVFGHKLLLTGTPIQNDVNEFWTLLNFISPSSFNNCGAFMEKYGDMKSKETIDALHEEIRPYILRRLKEDVEKSVPPKEETLIEVELTIAQKQYYRALYEKNVKFLHKNKKKALDGPSLNNLAMQLRKCCNHLFLLRGIEEEFRANTRKEEKWVTEGDLLVKASGKLVLLDKLLPRLKQDGHRILMFSQFKIMLDVLEDYLNERNMKFERIDGSITGKQRQQAIDRYQAPPAEGKESPFIMLLSTRAGGVGINLTAADTCIIFDSDWNPQNDLQAQARCHRIGQTKSVKVYRLLTSKTYEMQMFHMSSLKMGLDQAVLKGFESGTSGEGALTKEEVENLLRHGAYDIFNEAQDGSGEAESNAFVQQDIDTILARRSRTVVHENTGSGSNAVGGTFSKARFTAATQSDTKIGATEDVDIEDPDFWKKMVGEGPAEDLDDLPEKRRARTVQSYSEGDYDKRLNSSLLDSEAEADNGSDGDSGDESDYDEGHVGERCRWGGHKAKEWKKEQAKKLIHQLQSHGYGMLSWETFIKQYGGKQDVKEINRMCWAVVLTTLHEAAIDDANSAKRRADKVADKKREASGENVSNAGGILGVATSAGKGAQAVQSCFDKLWAENAAWLDLVLKDAQDFARSVQPRSEEFLDRVFHTGQSPLPPSEVSTMFAQNVWPSLKSRGWKAEMVTEGPHAGKTQYSYDGKLYWTPETVLSAAGGIHPELSNMLESLLKAVANSRQKSVESEAKAKAQHLAMASGNIDVDVLGEFLRKYAPLQLVFDRKSHKRLHLSKKTLVACSFVHAACSLVKRSGESRGDTSLLDKLSSFLSPLLDKRLARPHQLWSSHHDAVLLHAISKHGWIDSDASVRKITGDASIKWGFPFDADDDPQGSAETARLSQRDEMIANLRKTASRAANFLNVHPDLVDDMRSKGYDVDSVVRIFCLERDVEGSENEEVEKSQIGEKTAVWVVDDDALIKSTGLSSTKSSEPEELPPKKVLVKRARMVLTRAQGTIEQSSAPKEKKTVEQSPSQSRFAILDQSDKCNLLLAELLRMILKAPLPKMGKQVRLLLSIAAEEAGKLGLDDTASNIGLVKRSLKKATQAKNVLRVILGMDVSGSEPRFPEEHPAAAFSPGQGNSLSCPKGKKDDAAVGDRAVSRAMKRVFDEHGGPAIVSAEGTKNDLELTAVETLIISVLCSVGIPVWTHAWELLFHDDEGAKDKFTLVWRGVGNVLKSAATNWHESATRKLEQCRLECEKFDQQDHESQGKSRALKARDLAEREEQVKKIAAGQAADFALDPLTLAKKTVMLLERLRLKISRENVGNSKNNGSKKMNTGLGPKVLSWIGQQLGSWAKVLDIVDASGKTLSYTAIDFYHDIPREDREMIDVSACFSKQDCRHVLTQVAQLTRTRSLFLTQTRDSLVSKFERAAKNARVGDDWESRPSWWGIVDGATTYSVCHDVLLLESLIDVGFGGILEHAKGFGSSEVNDESSQPSTLKDLGVVKLTIQQRANQLTRELHALEEANDIIRMLGERKALAESNNTTKGKKSGSDNGKKQKSLHTFFKQTSKKATSTSVVVVLSDSDSLRSDDPTQKKLRPNKVANNENGDAIDDDVEIVGVSPAGEKRSESGLPGHDSGSPSPEKKLRIA